MSKKFISFLEQHLDHKNVVAYVKTPNDVGEYTPHRFLAEWMFPVLNK